MLLPIAAGEARLVWNLQVWLPDGSDVADFTIDAETGKVWTRISWVADADYRVYPVPVESPQHITPRYSKAELDGLIAPLLDEIHALKAQISSGV